MEFYDKEDILRETNGGLDIILWMYPDAYKAVSRKGTLFKVREEKTASVSLKKHSDGNYTVTDFGGDQTPRNAIGQYAFEKNISFADAIQALGKQFNIAPQGKPAAPAAPTYKNRNAKPEEKDGFYYYTQCEWSDELLATLYSTNVINYHKKDITALYKVAEHLHIKPISSYVMVGVKESRKATEVHATPGYPMFVFDEGDFMRIYRPKAEKDKRFRYWINPEAKVDLRSHLYGESQLKEAYQEHADKVLEDSDSENYDDDGKGKNKKPETRLPAAILLSGGSDAANVAAMGYYKGNFAYHVLWKNSESLLLTPAEFKRLNTCAVNVYQLQDIDDTGVAKAHDNALANLELKTIELPRELRHFRDWRRNPCKDVRDYFNHYKRKDFDTLVDMALPYQCWETTQTERGPKITLNHVRLYYFLSKMGFYRMRVNNGENTVFVQVAGNVVKQITHTDVEDFLYTFLEQRQADKDSNVDEKVRNFFYRTRDISESSMSKLPFIELDFSNNDADGQYFFFQNKTLHVTAKGIKEHKPGAIKKYVWAHDVIDHNIELLPAFFEPLKNADGLATDVKYLLPEKEEDCCIFTRFVIRTTQINWRAGHPEYGVPVEGSDERRYSKTDEEKLEERLHFLNRIFCIGYMLHRYKDPSKPWAVWGLEDKVTDSDVSAGGSGKSLLFKALQYLIKVEIIPARDQRLFDDKHSLANVNEHTALVIFDDPHQFFPFTHLYPMITGEWSIRPQYSNPFTLGYEIAPKAALPANFPPHNADSSTLRRILFTVFSDYFRGTNEDTGERGFQPIDEFKKNLFTQFNQNDWNRFYNFMLQCLQFYLSQGNNCIEAPMSNVRKRQQLAAMGENFKDWADVYFSENSGKLDVNVPRPEVMEDFKINTNTKDWKGQRFTKALKAWCKMNGYELNPPDKWTTKDKRIIDTVLVDGKDKTVEMLHISTKNKPARLTADIDNPAAPIPGDDLPF
jgi:hypothetical protein